MYVCDLQANNDILAFLSGMPVTRNTKYLDLKNAVSHWTAVLQTHHASPCSLFAFSQWLILLLSAPLWNNQKNKRLVQQKIITMLAPWRFFGLWITFKALSVSALHFVGSSSISTQMGEGSVSFLQSQRYKLRAGSTISRAHGARQAGLRLDKGRELPGVRWSLLPWG